MITLHLSFSIIILLSFLGIDDQYQTADEGGGPREYPPVSGHAELARHIGQSFFADEFDISFFQKKPIDHGLFSPLSMMTARYRDEGGGEMWDRIMGLLPGTEAELVE